jgi:PAS domain S-box-containing protein
MTERIQVVDSPRGEVERILLEGACALGRVASWPPALAYAARFLFDNGVPAFLVWGPEQRLLYNDACVALLGARHPAALGRPFGEAWPEAALLLSTAMERKAEAGCDSARAPVAARVVAPGFGAAGGAAEFILAPLRELDGTVGGYSCTVADGVGVGIGINGPQFRAIADTIPQMAWSTLPDGRHDYYSQRWYDFTGVQPGETDGEGWSEIVHADDRERTWAVWRHALATGLPYEIEYRLRHASGEYRWTLGRALPLRDDAGRIVRWIGTCTDIHELKASQAALRDARLRQDAALVAADIGTWTYDIQADLIHADRNLAAIFDVSDAGAAGAPLAHYVAAIHPDDLAGVEAAITASIASGDPFERQYRVRTGDGGWRHVLARAKVTRDDAGRPAWLPGIVLDVSRQKAVEDALRTSETRFRRLADSNVIGILRYRMDGAIIDANQSFFDMTGYSRADLEAGRLSSQALTPPEWLAGNAVVMEQLRRTGRMDSYIKEYYRKDGSRVSVQMGAATVDDNGEGIAYVVDISPIREAQQALARSEAQLRAAADALREADQRKDEFLAMLAHELRNPLAPIAAAADVLTIGKPDAARIRDVTAIIARQARHMTGLIDDLLDVSRVTRGQITLKRAPAALAALVAEAVEQVRPQIEAKGHHLALDLGPDAVLVDGDRKRLVQVFANLLGNAAKFTPDGGRIAVRLQIRPDAGAVELTVVDNGIGMPAPLLARAFDLFSQGDRSTERAQGGLGIGLALVRSLVELHGGRVGAESAGPGQGSRFSVTLPLPGGATAPAAPGSDPEGADGSAGAAAAGLRVLIVDDNVDAAQILAMFVEALGHRAHVLHSPGQALDYVRRTPLDLCVLDIGLPEFDGYELAARLRALPGLADLPLVALSGYGQVQDKAKAMAAGFDRHFVKPIQGSEVLELLTGVESMRMTPV